MEYDPLVRVAFCPLLFAANGGQFTPLGLPIFDPREYVSEEDPERGLGGDEVYYSPRGKCDEPWDCGTCPLMRQWIEGKLSEGWDVNWECIGCVKASQRLDKDADLERQLPGFFQGTDHPSLTGCSSCGCRSSFLQLVLRRPRST